MERKLYVSWYKLYFNDIFVDERTFSNHYYYDVPNEEPRVCKTFKNFKDFYSDYKHIFDGYKNYIFKNIVKVGNTVIKKENIVTENIFKNVKNPKIEKTFLILFPMIN